MLTYFCVTCPGIFIYLFNVFSIATSASVPMDVHGNSCSGSTAGLVTCSQPIGDLQPRGSSGLPWSLRAVPVDMWAH